MLLLLPAGGPQLAVTTDLRTAPVVGLLMASIRRADPGNGSALKANIFLELGSSPKLTAEVSQGCHYYNVGFASWKSSSESWI